MQFLSDMGISLDVTLALRQMGHNAKHLREENLQRMFDDEIIEKSSREDRIILTHDLDFGRLLALKQAYFFSCKNLLRFCRIGRCRNLCLHTRNKFFEALGRSSPVWFLCHSDFA